MAETVLVTGGTGFVAGWCIVELLQRGYKVRATLRNLSKEAAARAAIASVTDPEGRLSFVVADLIQDEGWDSAMAGCDYVLHVASPLGAKSPRDPNELIRPAREGTLRVLRAARKAGVKRVVMTSAAAAARPRNPDQPSDETVWADPGDRKYDAYRLSKILAERAAWDFMKEKAGSTSFTTILPSAVFGPLLTKDSLGSVQVIQRLLQGRPPGLPRLGFWIVDVRDLAALHVKAMVSPEAAGERFIAAGDFMWLEEVAATLKSALGGRAKKVPTGLLPDALIKFLALFIPQLMMFTDDLGRINKLTSAKARRVLGFKPRPAATTIIECAESLP